MSILSSTLVFLKEFFGYLCGLTRVTEENTADATSALRQQAQELKKIVEEQQQMANTPKVSSQSSVDQQALIDRVREGDF